MVNLSMDDVIGNYKAKEAICRAVSTRRSLLLFSVMGSGKTMLARRSTSVMPSMTEQERVECGWIYEVTGLGSEPFHRDGAPRPFRAPHYTCSQTALMGTDHSLGEVHCAHNGVLFLDEVDKFHPHVKDVLFTLHREDSFPNFVLIGASVLCPCGNRSIQSCCCSRAAVRDFQRRIQQGWDDTIRVHVSPKVRSVSVDR